MDPTSTTPLEFTEFTELHRLPPSKSGRKTPSTTPLEFTELHHRLPPLEIGPENSFNYPPPPVEFTELHRLPPPPSTRNQAGKTPSTPSRIHGTSSTPPVKIFQIRPPPKFNSQIRHWYIVIFFLLTSKEKLFGPTHFFWAGDATGLTKTK